MTFTHFTNSKYYTLVVAKGNISAFLRSEMENLDLSHIMCFEQSLLRYQFELLAFEHTYKTFKIKLWYPNLFRSMVVNFGQSVIWNPHLSTINKLFLSYIASGCHMSPLPQWKHVIKGLRKCWTNKKKLLNDFSCILGWYSKHVLSYTQLTPLLGNNCHDQQPWGSS